MLHNRRWMFPILHKELILNYWGGVRVKILRKLLGFDLTFLTYKLPNFGGFEWEIFTNFGMSEKSETFISENFRDSWFFLTCLTYKIFDFDLKKLKWKIFGNWDLFPKFSQIFGYKWEFSANFGISEKIETFIREFENLNFLTWTPKSKTRSGWYSQTW